MADEARFSIQAYLEKAQDVYAEMLAKAAVTFFDSDTAWLEVWLIELGEKVLRRIAQLNADREIH